MTVINRTQALVLGFFALAWVALITICWVVHGPSGFVVTPRICA